MKWMFKLVMVAAALWSGYWFIGARAQEKLYVTLLEESRAAGWTVESRNLGVVGFPSRFDTTLTELNLGDPSGRWGWQGEEFQIKALSYQPNHIIMAWPGEQVVETPQGSLSFNSELLRASVVVAAANNVPLTRLQIEGEEVALQSSRHGAANIASLNGALFRDETTSTRYRLGVNLADISPPAELSSLIGGGAFLPALIKSIHLSAQLDFDREIDRMAFEQGTPPKPVSAVIEPSTIIWGTSRLTLEGELSAANNGYIDGELRFNVRGWQPLFEVFKQASNLTATELLTLKRALDGASGGQDLVFTLSFADGEASIGPFTIGPAPVYPF